MLPSERIRHRYVNCRVISCAIFLILFITVLTKTMVPGIASRSRALYVDGGGGKVVSMSEKCGLSGERLSDVESPDYYKSVFRRLRRQGYLRPTSKSLCVNCVQDLELAAIKTAGHVSGAAFGDRGFHRSLSSDAFEFEFVGAGIENMKSWDLQPLETASEICRTLKPGGYLVVHVAVKDEYSFQSFINLFDSCEFLRYVDIGRLKSSSHVIRESIFTKKNHHSNSSFTNGDFPIPKYKWDLIDKLEPLSDEEPREDWTEWGKYEEAIKSFKYLPNLVDLSFKKRYIYIDLGARTFDSTIGNWFLKLYPKQGKEFEIFAIEADKTFHQEYKSKKGVTLLPYAAWIRNTTLVFGTRNKKREYTGKIQQEEPSVERDYAGEQGVVQAFDFSDWLIRSFSKRDFVVLKMDVEGTEMDLIPRLVETGAIGLIDEVFVECHYDRWVKCCSGKRINRYNKSYGECYDLFSKLREHGSVAHQWW